MRNNGIDESFWNTGLTLFFRVRGKVYKLPLPIRFKTELEKIEHEVRTHVGNNPDAPAQLRLKLFRAFNEELIYRYHSLKNVPYRDTADGGRPLTEEERSELRDIEQFDERWQVWSWFLPISMANWIIPTADDSIIEYSYPRSWELLRFLLGRRLREQVFEPAYNDLLADYLTTRATRFQTPWARRWIKFCFGMRTALLVVECAAVGLRGTAAAVLIPRWLREWLGPM